jgi:Tol biopolymer transport system component
MGEPSPGPPPPRTPLEDRLGSWKEIAAYLGRDVTTVQRWERREGMPVHRHLHDRMGSVYAFRQELDAWVRSRNPRTTPADERSSAEPDASLQSPPASRRPARLALGLALAGLVMAIGAGFWLLRIEHSWRNPVAESRFQSITDFDGVAPDAAISRDGHLVAFLSDHDGPMDVWVTQVGSGQFHNLTHGRAPGLVNPSVRNLRFSPDGSLVTFWVRRENGSRDGAIGTWAVPTLGGEPRPYLEGVAELDWSPDGTRLAYHTVEPGDPVYVSEDGPRSGSRPVYRAPAGIHCHFPLWAPDAAFLYFVRGRPPDEMDVWRVRPDGGPPERITAHAGRVSHPVLLDRRTLVYLAGAPDGSGPWLYGMDVERRVPHRLPSGLDRYTSLGASADGHRLVLTLAAPKRSLWSVPIADSPVVAAERIALTTGAGSSPRLGPGYLLYVSATGAGESLWKVARGVGAELWSGPGARLLGGPAISPDGRRIAFSARQDGRTLLYVMGSDGTGARVVAETLALRGAPAWARDGRSVTAAVHDDGVPHLYRVPVDGGPPSVLVREHSVDPAWSPDGQFVLYSGPEIGPSSVVKAVTPEGAPRLLSALTLARGSRLVFLPGGRSVVLLRGGASHWDLWRVELETGAERQLTRLPPDFDARDFDVSPDGREAVVERVQERSDVVLLDLPGR